MKQWESELVWGLFKRMAILNLLTGLLVYFWPMSLNYQITFISLAAAGDLIAFLVVIKMLKTAKEWRKKNRR